MCWTPAEYIVFLEIVHILKTVAPLWPVVSHLLSAKVSPEWRLDLGVGTLKKCPFPLNRGVPSKEVTYKDYVNIFCVSSIEVSQRRSSTVSIESNNRSPALARLERERTGQERSYREVLLLFRLLPCARLPRFLARMTILHWGAASRVNWPRAVLPCAPVLSFAHYFQAPATQATLT